MDLTQRYDPELTEALAAFPIEAMINWDDLPAGREFGKKMFEALRIDIPDSPHVAKQDRTVPGPEGAPQVPIRIYRPVQSAGTLPGLIWIHGGGYVLGDVQQDDFTVEHIVEAVGCVVVSVEYRLAPEHPFPAPAEDCYAALKWMAEQATEHGSANVSPYAAASRATNLEKLPPTFIAVGSHEVFLDEDVEYALRLARADIPVELHVYPCAFHGWDLVAPTAAVSQRFVVDLDEALKRALHPAPAPTPV